MQRTIILAVFLTALILSSTPSHALRCDNKLVSAGDYQYKVQLACGAPLTQEVIGYIDQEKNGDRIRVMKIEEWIIKTNGVYFRLEFEGNVLKKIDWVERE